MMAQYKGAAFGELSPHPFAVADAAYRYFDKISGSHYELIARTSLVQLLMEMTISWDADK